MFKTPQILTTRERLFSHEGNRCYLGGGLKGRVTFFFVRPGFGRISTRGSQDEYIELIKGSLPADKTNLFDGMYDLVIENIPKRDIQLVVCNRWVVYRHSQRD